MSDEATIRRLAENEVVFRQHNERVNRQLHELTDLARQHRQSNLLKHKGKPLQFHCECSDENCRQRIRIQPERYTEIHKNRHRFVVACGHQVSVTEKVVESNDDFCIVEKFFVPPEKGAKLNKTDINNA